jgi:uncharacterized protein (TIGR03435 family)
MLASSNKAYTLPDYEKQPSRKWAFQRCWFYSARFIPMQRRKMIVKKKMTFRLFALLAVAALPAVSQVRFEVASIRLSRSDAGPRDARKNFHGDRFDAEASTVGDILDMLNEYQLFRVIGGPGWMRTDRYDVHAKAGAEIPPKERKAAIMSLLAERFQLVSHYETREIPTMVLLAPKKPAGLKPAADGESSSLRFGQRCFYSLTAKGRKQLMQEEESWARLTEGVARVIRYA